MRRQRELTQRQATYLLTIRKLTRELHYTPSFREIADSLGLRSLSAVRSALALLERHGLVVLIPNKYRAIVVTTEGDRVAEKLESCP